MEKIRDERIWDRPYVVLGAGGMLGTALSEALRRRCWKWISLKRTDLDITDRERVETVLQEIRPGVIVNCASYTNVDGAESDPEKAFEVNGIGAGNVARAASRLKAIIVHISTDYVFNGRKEDPYLPEDGTNPINVYGASKLEGEKQVRQAEPKHLIIRTSWLFGPNGKNFVNTMIQLGRTHSRLDVVNDQRGTPTYTRHLAGAILDLIESKVDGIWHLTNAGYCTWWAFAEEIFRRNGMDIEVNPVLTEAFPRPASRPRNSVLDCSASYEVLGGPLPTWQEALEEYLGEMRKIQGEEGGRNKVE